MIEVAAAILHDDAGRVLICRRNGTDDCAGLWEFPGGKREKSEDWTECLVRECREELDIQIEVGELNDEFCYSYPQKNIHFRFYQAKIVTGVPCRRVHSQVIWVAKKNLNEYEFCPADKQLVARLSAEEK